MRFSSASVSASLCRFDFAALAWPQQLMHRLRQRQLFHDHAGGLRYFFFHRKQRAISAGQNDSCRFFGDFFAAIDLERAVELVGEFVRRHFGIGFDFFGAEQQILREQNGATPKNIKIDVFRIDVENGRRVF